MPRSTIPIALASHYQQRATTLCHVMRVQRSDGLVVATTDHNAPLTIGSDTFDTGLEVSQIQTVAGYAVGNMEVSVFPDDVITAIDLLAGKWNGSTYKVGFANWRSPADGIDWVKAGTLGEAEINDIGFFRIEFRGLMQAYQQPNGHVIQKTCPYDLGDAKCGVDLGPWTQTYAVTGVTSLYVFAASGALQVPDFYKEGKLRWLTGDNEDYEFKIKAFTSGAFTLAQPTPYTIQIGDTFEAIAGDQKRFLEDCRDKFDNVLNFGGEPHVPGSDKLLADPDVNQGP